MGLELEKHLYALDDNGKRNGLVAQPLQINSESRQWLVMQRPYRMPDAGGVEKEVVGGMGVMNGVGDTELQICLVSLGRRSGGFGLRRLSRPPTEA